MSDTNGLSIIVGQLLFEFSDFKDWVCHAQSAYGSCGVRTHDTVAIDIKGRICNRGLYWMIAEKEGAFPVKVYALANHDMKLEPKDQS